MSHDTIRRRPRRFYTSGDIMMMMPKPKPAPKFGPGNPVFDRANRTRRGR